MRTTRDWFRNTAGGLPATFWYLWVGTLINKLGSFVLVFLALYLTAERGLSTAATGLVIGLWGAGGAVGTMVGGMLADRWGRRPTLLTAQVGTAAGIVGLGLARPFWAIAVGALLLGAFAEAARPAFAAMVVDVVPEQDRLRAFNLNYWALNLGFAFSAVLAGLAAQANYLLLFLIEAATTLTAATVIFLKVRETRPGHLPAATRIPGTADRGGLRLVLTDRVFLGFVTLNLLISLVFLQHTSMLPIAMQADGISTATYGWVIALNGVLIVFGQLLIPRLIRGRGRSQVLALAAVIVGLGYGLTAFAHVAWFYAVTVLIWTVGEMLNAPANSTLLAELSPASMRGRYQGVFSLSWQLAGFAAPTLGGLVRERVGNSALWLGCAAVTGIAAVGYLLSGPACERRATALGQAETPTAPAARRLPQLGRTA